MIGDYLFNHKGFWVKAPGGETEWDHVCSLGCQFIKTHNSPLGVCMALYWSAHFRAVQSDLKDLIWIQRLYLNFSSNYTLLTLLIPKWKVSHHTSRRLSSCLFSDLEASVDPKPQHLSFLCLTKWWIRRILLLVQNFEHLSFISLYIFMYIYSAIKKLNMI